MFQSLEVFMDRADEQQSRITQLQLVLPWAREAKYILLYDFSPLPWFKQGYGSTGAVNHSLIN